MSIRSKLIFVIAFAVCGERVALADRILDQSFFDDRTHNKITFNVDGNGDPVDPGRGGLLPMPPEEYRDQGLQYVRGGFWARSSLKEIDDLLDAIASPPVFAFITRLERDDPTYISFEPHVRYFGTWVIYDTLGLGRTQFKAYDRNNKLIETATFDKKAVDGTILDGEVEYGFMGIAADHDIAYVTFPEGATFDDFYYAPEPSAAVLLLVAAAAGLRRR